MGIPRTFLASKYLINHVIFVLDASTSMRGHKAQQLVKVTAAEVAYLARRSGSDELNQETRVAIYTFDDEVRCIVPERDVMRLPSIEDVYLAEGNTALVDATILALDDIKLVSEKYGDHAFLIYVLTDGEENVSNYANRAALPGRLASLPENVTVACLVPQGKTYYGERSTVDEAVRWGFPRGNVGEWDVNAAGGVEAAASTIRVATNNFMVSRAQGVRSTTNLFSMDAAKVNDATVKATLTPLDHSAYALVPVVPPPASHEGKPWQIKEYAEHCGHKYIAGHTGYYELVKTPKKPSEVVQGNKEIIVVDKKTNQAYGGKDARALLGLGDQTQRVRPGDNPDYKIYILSSSVNRHLVPGTNLLVLK